MQKTVFDLAIACACMLGAVLVGVAVVRLGGADPALGLAAGGLFFLLCADIAAAAGARRRVAAMDAELNRLRTDYEALKASGGRQA